MSFRVLKKSVSSKITFETRLKTLYLHLQGVKKVMGPLRLPLSTFLEPLWGQKYDSNHFYTCIVLPTTYSYLVLSDDW